MDLRTREYSAEARKRLGDALTARRVAVDPAWANRAEFLRATGISKKLAERLETGQPGSYRTSTLAVVARAYRVTLESIAGVLDGGRLIPAAEARESEPDPGYLVPECEFELRILRSEILTDDLKRRIVRAHRSEEPGHGWCGFTEEQVRAGIASLAASYADRGPPDQAADAEFRWPGGARPAAG